MTLFMVHVFSRCAVLCGGVTREILFKSLELVGFYNGFERKNVYSQSKI